MENNNSKQARRLAEGVLGGADPAASDDLIDENIWVFTGLKAEAPITSKAEYAQCSPIP